MTDSEDVVITITIPPHLAHRLDELAKRLGTTLEQITLSALGASVAGEYLDELGKLASALEQARRQRQ